MSLEQKIERLKAKHAAAQAGGGEARVAKQHEGGKLTARERVAALLDEGSFEEMDALVVHRQDGIEKIPGDGVVTGFGRVDGRPVAIFAQDFTVFGGSLSEGYAKKICKVMDLAMKVGCPIVGLNDSGGARIQEGVVSLGGYADIFLRNTLASGVIPQVSLIMGPCAGGAVYSPAITDFITMVRGTSYMFVTGPDVIKAVTHEEVTKEELGGASTHSAKSGVAHFVQASDLAALAHTRELLSFLPSNNLGEAPRKPPKAPQPLENPALDEVVPDDASKPYDIRLIIKGVVDAPGWRYTSIITNGWFLSEDRAQKLMDTGIDQINVSLNYPDVRQDTDRKLPGLFKKISHIIPWMAKRGANVQLNTIIMNDNLDDIVPIAEQAARWGASVMYTLYSELPADNHGHLFPIERQARLFEVIRELSAMKKRMPNVVANTSWYFDMIPTYVGGTVIDGCTAGKKTLHISPGGMVRACAELPMMEHWSTYDHRAAAPVECTRCFQACRGEVQAPITLGRVVEMLRT